MLDKVSHWHIGIQSNAYRIESREFCCTHDIRYCTQYNFRQMLSFVEGLVKLDRIVVAKGD